MITGMEKSFSANSNYQPSPESGMMADQDFRHWPANLNPSDDPMSFHEAINIPDLGSGNHSDWIRRSQDPVSLQHREAEALHQYSPNMPTCAQRDNMLEQGLPGMRENKRKAGQQLSNAPQTKSQHQQRNALNKLSQAVSNEAENAGSSLPIDLEQLVLRVLSGSTDAARQAEIPRQKPGSSNNRPPSSRGNKVYLTKHEALKASQMISNLIKQTPTSAYSRPRRASQGFSSNNKVCTLCGYAAARECDLKKHMKRHEKPYGCTYPKCHKRFGAKSDWKRHENSQHFQLEAYRCAQKNAKGEVCGEHFLRVGPFTKHLEAYHHMSSPEVREHEARRRRIGKNCQQQFWCGFHDEIIVLREKRNAAWDERFDHIAAHFEKEKRRIEEWVCVEENRTKKELLKEMDRYVFDDEDERDADAVGETEDVGDIAPPSCPPDLGPVVGDKRGLSEDAQSQPSRKRTRYATTTACVSFESSVYGHGLI
jgi:hypothetical protein